jgi:hypothetical protein
MNRKLLLAPLALTLALSVGACKDLLTEKPRSFQTTDQFYTTAEDARAAVVAAYQGLNDSANIFHGVTDWIWMMDLEDHSDDANVNPADQNPEAHHLGNLQWDTQNGFMVPFWQNGNRTLYRINLALSRLPDSPMPAAEKAVAIGELKFLRAWMYTQFEKRYGGVPIYRTEEDHANTQPVRATREELDAFIIQDLTEAEAALPVSWPASDWGRVTKGAARMGLADIYNWRSSRYNSNEWAKASEWSKKVIDSGTYRLLDNQLNVFLPTNKGNAEMIFARTSTGTENRSSSTVLAAHYPRELAPGGGFGVVTPLPWTYQAYAPGDYRLETSFRFNACNLGGTQCFTPLPQGSQPYKFRPTNQTDWWKGDTDIPLYRYAEALLYYAEAQNELGNPGEAIRYVNFIRARARKGTGSENRSQPADLPGMSKIQARDAIYLERHFELVWEVKRWWDLLRRDTVEPGSWKATMAAHDPESISQGPIQDFRKLWPIPQREIDVSRGSLVQNPGY